MSFYLGSLQLPRHWRDFDCLFISALAVCLFDCQFIEPYYWLGNYGSKHRLHSTHSFGSVCLLSSACHLPPLRPRVHPETAAANSDFFLIDRQAPNFITIDLYAITHIGIGTRAPQGPRHYPCKPIYFDPRVRARSHYRNQWWIA